MTTNEAIRCYVAACPADRDILDPEDPRRADIAREVRAIVAAKSLAEARKVIEWWHTEWETGQLTRIVNTIRRAAGAPGFKR